MAGATNNTYAVLISEQFSNLGGWMGYGKLAAQISEYKEIRTLFRCQKYVHNFGRSLTTLTAMDDG